MPGHVLQEMIHGRLDDGIRLTKRLWEGDCEEVTGPGLPGHFLFREGPLEDTLLVTSFEGLLYLRRFRSFLLIFRPCFASKSASAALRFLRSSLIA